MKTFPDDYTDYAFVFAAFMTGIFSWFFGKKWNTKNSRVVIDEKTNERILLTNNHTLFWIKMEYWGIIFVVLGIVVLFQNSVKSAIIAILLFAIFMGVQLLTNRKKPTEKIEMNPSQHKKNKPLQNNSKSQTTPSSLKKEMFSNITLDEEKIERRKEKEDPSRFMPK
ncbi:hypothetical protein [Aquimarina sp. 2-A2]|uniref:hypothetical protein n=1 Tax=Aquimarina sp. 2-A2 TaxID=3382644 RepID=UPI00388E73F9